MCPCTCGAPTAVLWNLVVSLSLERDQRLRICQLPGPFACAQRACGSGSESIICRTRPPGLLLLCPFIPGRRQFALILSLSGPVI